MTDAYDGTDVGDVVKNLADVRPLVPTNRDKVLELARDTLGKLTSDEAVVELLGDPVRVDALGMLAHLDELAWDAALASLEVDGKVRHKLRGLLSKSVRAASERAADQARNLQARRAAAAVFRFLEDAGVDAPKKLRAPFGYTVDRSGIWLRKKHITSRPILPLGYLRHAETGEVSVRLVWTSPSHQVIERYVPRTALDDPKALKASAPMLPLIPEPKHLTAYFAAFEDINGSRLPERRLTERLGWHSNEFVLPDSNAPDLVLQLDHGREEARIADDVRSAGTLDGWRARFDAAPPLVQVAMLASACTPLLEPCNAPGFVVDLAGLSSAGKTVALVAAATAWGPGKGRMLGTWESTKAAIMARAGFLHSLPVLLDDTKHAQHSPTLIPEVVYAITGGRERERGHRDGGMRRSATWRTCMVSTGEQRITTFSPDKGTRGRVLGFWASPFRSGAEAKAYVDDLGEHYGHAGPYVARYATKHWSRLEELHRTTAADLLEELSSIPGDLTARLLPHVASLAVCARALGVQASEALAAALRAAVEADEAGDVHLQAFHDLQGWCLANRHRFGRLTEAGGWVEAYPPPQGWAGRIDDDGSIWLLCPVFEEQLRRLGHRPGECIDAWKAKGLTDDKSSPRRLPGSGRIKARGRFLWPME